MTNILDIALIITSVGLILGVILQSKGAGLGGLTGAPVGFDLRLSTLPLIAGFRHAGVGRARHHDWRGDHQKGQRKNLHHAPTANTRQAEVTTTAISEAGR